MKVLCTGGSGFIGTQLVTDLLAAGAELLNIDIAEPKKKEHLTYWRNCNILHSEQLESIFAEFEPTHIVHLAARTTMQGHSLDDFRDNTIGTANVLTATKKTLSSTRIIITSSQHVRRPGSGLPRSDDDFVPHGLYGESKVITEILTREIFLPCSKTIIRPTTIWGPYHPSLPDGLWKLMSKGLYFHPADDPVVRSYGYVKNITWQIKKILDAPQDMVNGKTYYVGDIPIKQVEWINGFSNALIHRNVLQIPKGFIHLLAYAGDLLERAKLNFPMNSKRYFNLTTSNAVLITPVIDAFGFPPYSMDAGIEETVNWLKREKYI